MYGFSINKKPSMYDGSSIINIQQNLKQEEEEEVSHADIYAKESDFTPGPSHSGADQLALTFQGEVYVSNSVSPDKVQGVLLLLGEYKIRSDIPALGTVPVTQRHMDDIRGKLIQPQRAASLCRFRGKKRKERSFDKKIGYNVRKELALRMRRKNSQITSAKAVSKEVAASTSAGWNGTYKPGQDEQASLCKHCGISYKSTPQMRHGPAGPKTLCNACGLNWVKKGVLRDLSKVSSVPTQDQTAKITEQSDSEANDSEAVTVTADVVSSLKPPKDEWMLRKNGQFKSAKAVSKEVAASTSSGWKGTSNPGQDEQASLCKHCGISCKSTPQMRRGPAGPKTLCNACGLNWVKKGVLRDLSKVSSVPTQDQTAMTTEQSDSEANDSEAVTVIADFLSSLKPPKDEWLRKNSQFTSAKGVCKEVAASTSEGWKGMSNSGKHDQTSLCKHCGISCKSTPQMRLGPAGPKTLCNACGLNWVKKGVLRDLSKVSSVPTQDQTAKTTEQSDFEANDSDAVTMTTDVVSSLKPLKDEWMLRKNGQFTSGKAVSKEVAASTSAGWKGMSSPGQHEQSSLCKQCGISRKSTPQMRRGPAGPKTLCNACGLNWVKKGVLRDLSKVSSVPTQDQTAKTAEQSDSEANDSKAVTVIADVLSSLKPLKDEWVLRKNGQFTSAKAVSKEVAASTSAGRKGMSNPGQHEQSRLCKHCGISCKSTPQMRRGPAGPKTLCNACGLNWVKKGVLRDLSKVSSVPTQDQTAKTTDQSDSEANDSEAVTVAADVVLSLKPPKDEWQVP